MLNSWLHLAVENEYTCGKGRWLRRGKESVNQGSGKAGESSVENKARLKLGKGRDEI